ncbi:MAG: hypothetical protein D6736_14375 [Nitrospinota bacterium]|nr:MAG: hypothetical protein D6736_14375 [Nitrospinota bacterium]
MGERQERKQGVTWEGRLMSLRVRILAILCLVVVLYAVLDYSIQRFVIFPSFTALEREEAQKDLERSVEALQREIYHLSLLCNDWAAWDDTYAFVQDRNPAYIESNLVLSSFTDNNLNLIYIVDTQGQVVWGEIRDLETEETIQVQEFPSQAFPPSHPLLQHRDVESAINGVLLTEKGPMLVASRPIVTSDEDQNASTRGVSG